MWEPIEGNQEYYDRKQQQEQFDEKQKLEKQKMELQKQELQTKQQQIKVQQQQQATNQKLVIGGFALASIIVITVCVTVIVRVLKKSRK